ncbi:MAG: adenylate/guanylate cyclase domain-containing protein [Gammaproteobacteria bacterium]|nr:adenylate/guanylate cyclase domain-containing protein [Gammaproteobacteria bacterium]
MLADEVSAVGGRIIKQIGDELMCTFEEPTDAVDLATIMQAALDDLVSDGLHSHLRIGLHCGPVVDEHGDVFGDTVNIAARMTSIAGPGQVIASEDIVSRLPEEQRDSTRLFDRVKVKGSRCERAIYRILWSPRSETWGRSCTRRDGIPPGAPWSSPVATSSCGSNPVARMPDSDAIAAAKWSCGARWRRAFMP